MLDSGKPAVFAGFSIIIHLLFALLFFRVTLSFTPPTVKKLSLILTTGGASQSEIVQTDATWPSPQRVELDLPVDQILSRLESKIPAFIELKPPELSLFAPRQTLFPSIKTPEIADKIRPRPQDDFFAPLPAESKPMPIAEFALGSDFPEIFGDD